MTDSFDVDRLDAWLDGKPYPSTSMNGHSDTQADLVGTAQRFHAGIGAAEQTMPIPTRAIWEDVMQHTANLTITSPVTLTSNGDGASRPSVPPGLPVSESSHGHGSWFVTGSLVVIVMLAISAFAYLASRPPSDSNHDELPGLAFSASTPDATPTSNADLERWLLPPTEVDCGAFAGEPRPGFDSSGWPTNLDLIASSYFPFSSASALTQQQIATTSTLGMFSCGETPTLTAEFAWMPGPSVVVPTDDQITAAREISGALPDQNPENYLIVRQVEDAPDEAWPVIIPEDVLTLADGRVGAPVRWVSPSVEFADSMMESTPGNSLSSLFFTFDRRGTDWLLDEIFLICIGDCDVFWTDMVNGTNPEGTPGSMVVPEATPITAAALPAITAEECTIEGLTQDEVSAIVRDPGEKPARSYVPVGPADPADAEAAHRADRAWQACNRFGSIGQRTVLQTPWLTATGPEDDPNLMTTTAADAIAVIEQRRPLSEGILTDNQMDYVVASGQTQSEMLSSLTGTGAYLPHPREAFVLRDGRIAIPQVWLAPDDAYIFSDDYEPPVPYFMIQVHILSQDPETDSWQVDEVIWLTGGNVDSRIAFVREQEAAWLEQSGQEPATPEATPATGS